MYFEYLWSPGRMKWVKKARPYKGCVFCGIAKDDPKVPKKVIYKDDVVLVVMNIFPYNVGHVQVIPRRHAEWFGDLTEEEYLHFTKMIRKTVKMLKVALKPTGFNVGFNLGTHSGQSITHLHCQIVPRYAKEVGFMESLLGTKVMPESLHATYMRIKKHADILKK